MDEAKKEEEEKMIRETWFGRHEARYGTSPLSLLKKGDSAPNTIFTEMIVWKRPDSYMYSVTYTRQGPFLIVTGDLGHAIYCVSSLQSFKFFLDCNLGYFAS